MTTLDNSSEFEDAADSSGMSRRSLVRTGAMGAIAVPAITIASAAPAMAANTSGGSNGGTFLAANLSVTRNGTSVKFTIPISNALAQPTTALKVYLTIDALTQLPLGDLLPANALVKGGSIKDASAAPVPGWKVYKSGSIIPVGGQLLKALLGSVTFTYIADVQLGVGDRTILEGEITLPPVGNIGYLFAGKVAPGTGLPTPLVSVRF